MARSNLNIAGDSDAPSTACELRYLFRTVDEYSQASRRDCCYTLRSQLHRFLVLESSARIS